MNRINCDICKDLFPLVKDGVASDDSKNAVFEHIKNCKECKAFFDGELAQEAVPEFDDKKIAGRIKNSLLTVLTAVIFAAMLLGASLSSSAWVFYNILLFPLIGAMSFLLFKKKSLIAPITLFTVTFVWSFIRNCCAGEKINDFVSSCAIESGVYTILCLLGVLIGFLLYVAFRKERAENEN